MTRLQDLHVGRCRCRHRVTGGGSRRSQAGTHTFNVTVYDGTATDSQQVAITVSEVNLPPTLALPPIPASIASGEALVFGTNATDPDIPENTLTYGLEGEPSGAGITTQGQFNWTPDRTQAGTHTFNVTVYDGTATVRKTVSVTVIASNAAPILNGIGSRSVDEGSVLSFVVSATDVNQDDLSYSMSGAPPEATLNQTSGSFRWIPLEEQGPNSYNVTFGVDDGRGGNDSEVVTITVNEVNQPPTLQAIGSRTVQEGSALSFTGNATDSDIPANDLTYGAVGLPEGAAIDPDTGQFSWTPSEAQSPAAHTFNVTVSDGAGGADSETVTITVDEVNDPPVTDAGANQIVSAGETVILAGTASDPDDDPLTYTWRQTAGSPVVALANHDTLSPSFTAPRVVANTTLVFSLTVGDGLHNSTDTVQVMVRVVPEISHFVTTWRTTAPGESITIPVGGSSNTYTVDWGDGTVSAGVSGDQTHSYNNAGTHTVRIYGDFERIFLEGDTRNAAKLQSIEQWGNIRWASMDHAFSWASNMIYRATDAPDLSGVTDMSGMFSHASSFNQPLNSWDVSSVTDMAYMFSHASSFNQPLNSWDVSAVTDMSGMFYYISSFNQPLNSWDVSAVTDMSGMFYYISSFNQPLNSWDVSAVTDMHGMFYHASSFNQSISAWDVSAVTYMQYMFLGASSFNQPLNSWDVSSVTNMDAMFYNADRFDGNLGGWYLVLDGTTVDPDTGIVGSIAAQNAFLDGQDPVYAMATGGDSDLFEMDGAALKLKTVPNHSAKDSYTVTVTSSGGFGTDNSQTFIIAGIATSARQSTAAAPVLDTIGPKTINEGSELEIILGATDPDTPVDQLTYGMPGAPAGAQLNSTAGRFSWTPAEAQGPDTYDITLEVSDGQGGQDEETVTITVREVNLPPTLALPADMPSDVDEGLAVSFTATATDLDLPANNLTYGLLNGPAGAEITDDGQFSWTPAEAQGPGTHTFNVTVTDGTAIDSQQVAITVSEVNRPPTLALPTIPASIAQGETLTFTAGATDPDIPENTMTYGLKGGPSGAGITIQGQFSWTPDETQAGSHTFNITVTDGTASDSQQLSISVIEPAPPTNSTAPQPLPSNEAPVLAGIGDRSVTELSALSFDLRATDGNQNDTLAYSMAGAPEGASLDHTGGRFSWIPAESQGPGTYDITFRVEDGNGAADSERVAISVSEANQRPEFEAGASETHRCNAAVNGTVNLSFGVVDADLPAQDLRIADSSGDIAYDASLAGSALKFSTTLRATDQHPLPDDGLVVFYIQVADSHEPPGTVSKVIYVHLPDAHESGLPGC